MERDLVQAAVLVLGAYAVQELPDQKELAILKTCHPDALDVPADELARCVVEQYLREARRRKSRWV
jgi:hypothetical protein